MLTNRLTHLAVAAAVMMSCGEALAHHSSAEYDRTKSITLQGTVTEFRYANPHPQLYFDVKDSNGAVAHWAAEIGPNPTRLNSIGWDKKRSDEALAPGATITITVAPSKLSPRIGVAKKILDARGEQILDLEGAPTN